MTAPHEQSPPPQTGLGFFWLLPGFLAPLAATAVSAGTIAAVAGPLAELLAKAAGPDTDFGKAMITFRDVANIVKIPSIIGAGYTGLLEGGIPGAFQAAAARWYETLRSPVEAAGGPAAAAKLPEVARTLAWAEKSLAQSLPAHIATQAAPQLLDAFSKGVTGPLGVGSAKQAIENALNTVKGLQEKYLLEEWKRNKAAFPPWFDESKVKKLAEDQVLHATKVMVAAPPPAPPPASEIPGVKAPKTTTSAETRRAEEAAAAARISPLGTAMATVGLVGLAGAAAVKFTPQKYQRKLGVPRASNKQLLIAGGISGALALFGFVLRNRTSDEEVKKRVEAEQTYAGGSKGGIIRAT